MGEPTASAVLYQLASLATIAQRGGDVEATNRQLREHLKEFNPTHLRALAATLPPPVPAAPGSIERERDAYRNLVVVLRKEAVDDGNQPWRTAQYFSDHVIRRIDGQLMAEKLPPISAQEPGHA